MADEGASLHELAHEVHDAVLAGAVSDLVGEEFDLTEAMSVVSLIAGREMDAALAAASDDSDANIDRLRVAMTNAALTGLLVGIAAAPSHDETVVAYRLDSEDIAALVAAALNGGGVTLKFVTE